MGNPEYTLGMEERNNYLYVCATGVRSQDTVKAITIEVFQTAREKKIQSVLIDVRGLAGNFGFMDIFFYVTNVLDNLRGKGVYQIAVVDVKRSFKPGWFLETVAQNHGLNFRVFEDEAPAVKWLEA
jgi:hypothetical protein